MTLVDIATVTFANPLRMLGLDVRATRSLLLDRIPTSVKYDAESDTLVTHQVPSS